MAYRAETPYAVAVGEGVRKYQNEGEPVWFTLKHLAKTMGVKVTHNLRRRIKDLYEQGWIERYPVLGDGEAYFMYKMTPFTHGDWWR